MIGACMSDEKNKSEMNESKELNLDRVLDVKVNLSLEVGRVNLSLRELLDLNQGSIVELDRLAGEPLDVLVNGTLIAKGEVVLVEDKFGVYLTDVVEKEQRTGIMNH